MKKVLIFIIFINTGFTQCPYTLDTLAYLPPAQTDTLIVLDNQPAGGSSWTKIPLHFPFEYNCVQYDSVYVSSRGALTFDAPFVDSCQTLAGVYSGAYYFSDTTYHFITVDRTYTFLDRSLRVCWDSIVVGGTTYQPFSSILLKERCNEIQINMRYPGLTTLTTTGCYPVAPDVNCDYRDFLAIRLKYSHCDLQGTLDQVPDTLPATYFYDSLLIIHITPGLYVSDSESSNYFVVPNAFTPNNDGINDLFQPITNQDYRVAIFDRWGELLYQGKTPWDGTYKGQLLNPGIFVYKILADKLYTGNVTLLR